MARELPKDIFNLTVVWKTLKIVWEASRRHTIIRIFLVILNSILPLIPIFLFGTLLDAFATSETVDLNLVYKVLGAMAFLSLFMIVIKNIAAYNNSIQADIITDHMSNILMTKSLDIDLEFFDSDKYHDQMSRAMSQGGTTPLGVLGLVTSLAQNSIMLIAILGYLFTLHWSITFILFLITLPVAIIRFKYSEKLVDLREAQTQPSRINGYYRSILTSGGPAKEVRIFSFGDYMLEKFLSLASFLRKERRDLYLEELKWVSIAQSAEVLAMLSALGFIVYKAIIGNLSVGDITIYYMAFSKGQSNVSGIMGSLISIHKSKLMLNYLYEFLYMEKRILDPENPEELNSKIDTVEVKDLNFIYPGTTKTVLKDINLKFKKGEMIAVVGENGSGKTTLVKLLNRLYSPTEGNIYIDDVPYNNFKLLDLRKRITVIFQKFSSYALTVRENICLSDVYQEFDSDKMKKAARLAMADTFIEKLPKGYEAQLGRAFKDGHELSKGQWQKVALSRAFYKDADLIVLDEPTSFIDPIAEDTIFQNFRKESRDKILILITHRIYNLVWADKIIVMHEGEIVEVGKHEELINNDGLYAQMFSKQNVEDIILSKNQA